MKTITKALVEDRRGWRDGDGLRRSRAGAVIATATATAAASMPATSSPAR